MIVLRSVPVGYRVERFSPKAATIAVWYVGIVGSGATVQPQQSWRTQVVSLVWEARCLEGQLVRKLAGTDASPLDRRDRLRPGRPLRRDPALRGVRACRTVSATGSLRPLADRAIAALCCSAPPLLVGAAIAAARAPSVPAASRTRATCPSSGTSATPSRARSKAAAEAGEFVMRGVTAWVTNAAVWVAGKVGELIENTSSPDLRAGWFEGQYQAMLAIAGALALLMLMLAVIQSVIRQDIWMLIRAAFGYLPMAFIFAGVAIAATGLLVAITDDMSAAVVASLGTEQSDNLLQAVGDAYKNALDEDSGIPLFGVFLGAIILALGAFVLWLEMIIRDAAIYICVFFLPLTFVAMVWPATSRWARRLVELLIAIILAKFVIVSILTLATAAIANTGVAESDSTTFEQMLAGSAILVLAAWSPFALLRMIPMMELAAASVVHQRSAVQSAAGSAGMHSPAVYMRRPWTGIRGGRRPAAAAGDRQRSTSAALACRAPRRRTTRRRGTSTQAAAPTQVGGVVSAPGRAPTASPGRSSAPSTAEPRTQTGQPDPSRPTTPGVASGPRPPESLPRRDRGRLNRRSTDARLPNRRLIDARRRSRRLTGVHRSTEVKRERRRVSALPLRPARAAGADRFATAGPGDRDRRQPHAGGVLMRVLSSGAGVVAALALALVAAAFCFWPVGGRSAEAWLPVIARHATATALGRHVRRSPAPNAGARLAADGRPEPIASLPEVGRDLELLAAPFHGEPVGVLKDRRARSYTAVLAVRVTSFGLLDRAEQESRQAGWGGVLAGLAREGSPVSRIQWVERTVPADGDEIGRYLGEAWDARRRSARLARHAVVPRADIERRPAVTKDHELFVSACRSTPSAHGGRSSARAAEKGPDAGACAVLLRELEALAERLAAADVRVVGALRPGHARDRDPRRVRPLVAAGPRAARGRRPRPRRHRRGRRMAARDGRRRGTRTGRTAPFTRPTGSRAGRVSTSAPPSSHRSSCTRRWCGRSRSRSSRSRR